MAANTKRLTERFYPLLILAAGMVAYSNSFQGAFVLDDTRTIVENIRIRHLLPRNIHEWLGPRSVGNLTFALNYAIGKLNPADYHLANLVIHLAVGLILYAFVKRSLLLPVVPERLRIAAPPLAFFVAALWTVHPLTTSCVTYVSQRYESLMSFFYLLTLYGMLQGAVSQHERLWYSVAVGSCVLGMLTKEVMVTAPLAGLAYDYLFLSSGLRDALRRRWGLYLGLSCSWVVLAVSMSLGVPSCASSGEVYGRFPSIPYALTQAGVILHYLRLVFWPRPLCLDYGWQIASGLKEVLPQVLVVGGLFAMSVILLLCRSLFSYPLFLFFLLLAPTSSLVPRPDPAFEHRMYLPLAAIVGVVVTGSYYVVTETLQRLKPGGNVRSTRVVLGVFGAGAIVCLGGMTFSRNKIYASAELLWNDVLRTRPNNVRAYQNLANLALVAGRDQNVLALCQEGLRRLPDFGRMKREDLIKIEKTPAGERLWRAAFEYSGLQNTMGLVLSRTDPAAAERHFREALRVAPGNLKARHNLAITLFRGGRYAEAMGEWEEVLRVTPSNPDTLLCLAEAGHLAGRPAMAVQYLVSLLQYVPDHPRALLRLAWILATASDDSVRDGHRAVALAERACRLAGYENVECLEVLAAACAEAGQFDKARQTIVRALQLAEKINSGEEEGMTGGEEKKTRLRARLKDRLRLYESGVPYREKAPRGVGNGNAENESLQ
ncbi:MAG: tetratricopeptide repeat protein [Kiritimatiellae bacterium]|nr:tetratricopeptide repeat protein [Kiritimatiellia bacterium]